MVLKMTIDVENLVYESRDQYMEEGLKDNNRAVLTSKVVEKDESINNLNLFIILSISFLVLILLTVAIFLTVKKVVRIQIPKGKNPQTRERSEEILLDDSELSELESLMGRLGS
jgi:hypothetical protein